MLFLSFTSLALSANDEIFCLHSVFSFVIFSFAYIYFFLQEVSAQLRALLQPTTLATVQLFHRLISIVQDLDVLMRALSADNEVRDFSFFLVFFFEFNEC